LRRRIEQTEEWCEPLKSQTGWPDEFLNKLPKM
jgi:hypothetical protein